MSNEVELKNYYALLTKVLARLDTKQSKCQRDDDIKQKNDLLRKIKKLKNEKK